jgi:hypothetical protein
MSGTQPTASTGAGTVAEKVRDVPAGDPQLRSSRPRPALCASATTTSQARPRSIATALVDGSSSWTSTERPPSCGSTQPRGETSASRCPSFAMGRAMTRLLFGSCRTTVFLTRPLPNLLTCPPPPASLRSCVAASPKWPTPARRRPSRSSTPRARRPPASGSSCCSTRARSSRWTSTPDTAAASSARTAPALRRRRRHRLRPDRRPPGGRVRPGLHRLRRVAR